jgi:protoporphyrinogen oxidase
MAKRVAILGAGVTGLAAGVASGQPVYEAEKVPGGICSSYFRSPGLADRSEVRPHDEEVYRFETGGGHWIFGGDPLITRFITSFTPIASYARRSSVYFPDKDLLVPYPIQNHLRYLPSALVGRSLSEIVEETSRGHNIVTMADWMRANFGPTLCELFFDPFHERYTAGLWREIAPQDGYKSPGGLSAILQGAFADTPAVGYNTKFIYPTDGLDALAQRMAGISDIRYGKRATRIEAERKVVKFSDGSGLSYDLLISTLPLNRVMELSGLRVASRPDPYTSVLVLNIGGVRGHRCPDDHWVYVVGSEAGFHRVGFYSNVDTLFLPASVRDRQDRVAIYVEFAHPGGQKPSTEETGKLRGSVVEELQAWGWLREAEVVDPTWIDVAYTWSWPGSRWRQEALALLEAHDIHQVGRYAEWRFQGIAQSIRDGLAAGAALGRR